MPVGQKNHSLNNETECVVGVVFRTFDGKKKCNFRHICSYHVKCCTHSDGNGKNMDIHSDIVDFSLSNHLLSMRDRAFFSKTNYTDPKTHRSSTTMLVEGATDPQCFVTWGQIEKLVSQ